jgi:lipopolysaccharide heptosyltransferase II
MGTKIRESLLDWALHAALRIDKRQPERAELGTPAIKRILAVSCTAIGDTLMSTPALRSLRLAYPDAHIALLVNPPYASLFATNPDINQQIPYDGRWKGFWRMALKLRRERFDLVAILHGNDPQATPLAYLSGARWRFKLPNTSRFRFLLTNHADVKTWADFGHGIEQRLAVAKLAGGAATDRTMTLPVDPAAATKLNQRLADSWGIGAQDVVLGFQPGASTTSRRWPAERYAELGHRLLARYPNLRIVITGSPAERELAGRIAGQIGSERVAVTAGEVPLAEMPALVHRFAALVTPDTGIMHMAVAVDTPVVAMFAAAHHSGSGPVQQLERHTIIQKWRTCDPCLGKRCPYPAPLCMDNISVDEMETACHRYLIQETVQ